MNQEHLVSRRASLKGLGAMGAVLVLREAATVSSQAAPGPPGGSQDKQAASVVDVAIGRFTKGHS